jgi:predicted HD phosphohydrolase
MRDKYSDSPYFESCREFCEKYDQNSFDPDYDSLDLDFLFLWLKTYLKTKKIYISTIINDR